MAILLSCIVAFRDANFTKSLLEYRWLSGSLLLLAVASVSSWIFREYEAAPFRSVKPYLTLVAIIPLILAIRATNFRRWHISIIAISAGLSLGIYALSEVYAGTLGRWDATENAVEFGNYAALVGGLLLIISTEFRAKKVKWLFIGLSLIGSFAAFYVAYKSGTRSSLGIVALSVTGILVYFSVLRKNLLVLGIITVLTIAVGAEVKESPRFEKLVIEVSLALQGGYVGDSLGQRLELWRLSMCIADEHPALGVGTGSFKHAQLDNWPANCGVRIRAPKGYFSQAHSVYFQTLTTMGYLGLASLLLVFATLVFTSIRHVSGGGLPLVFLVGSFVVAGLTVDLFFKDFMVARFVLLTSLGLAWLQHNDSGGFKGIP
ncbi:MAG: O-antigen ligase family protein [Pseudomonadota bacterium]|nr:O-antigen ligase family protein [Pseudomonadota bacterium]